MTRKELIKELKSMGITKVFNRPLSYCTKEDLEYIYNIIKNRELKIQHLSFAQIDLYQKCPRQFYYRYVRGLKIPPKGAVVVGKASHKAVEVDLKTKLKEGREESWSVIEDVYVETFKESADEALWESEKEKEEELKLGLGALKEYKEKMIPLIEPVEVESEVKMKLPSLNCYLVGVVDVIDGNEGAILEHKTSKRAYSDNKINSLQLSIYSIAKRIPIVGFNVLVRTKNPKIQTLRKIVTDDDVLITLANILHTANSIYMLSFPPTQQGSWMCSEKWCGYWDICRRELAEQAKDFLQKEIEFLTEGIHG